MTEIVNAKELGYEIWLTDDRGGRIAIIDNFIMLNASRVVDFIGSFTLSLPTTFDTNLISADKMIQIWRKPTGSRLSLWRVYFLRKWRFQTRGSDEIITITGPDINDLLRRRNVIAYAGSAEASKTDFADDMMKEIVAESIADSVEPTPDAGTRVWADLSIASDLGLGPTITKSFPFDKLLTKSGQGVLAVLAKASREAGTEVFFDIVPDVVGSNSITFQFRTNTEQPGQDVSDRVVFDQERGNMRNPSLEYDYTNEENYIYGGGQGKGAARNIQQASDSTRYGISQWNRCEGFADARNQSTDDGVREAARSKLENGRPKIRFSAIPIDTAGTRFGVDWDFGYKVKASYKNFEFDTIIRAASISVNSGGEQIRARLELEE